MYSTLAVVSFAVISFLDYNRYKWTNIYRYLSQSRLDNSSNIFFKQFLQHEPAKELVDFAMTNYEIHDSPEYFFHFVNMIFLSYSLFNVDKFYTELMLDTKKAKVKVKKPTDETVKTLQIGKISRNINITFCRKYL